MVAGLLLGAVLGVCAATAQAGTVYWVTDGGGDYGTAGNWSTGALPGASDTAVFNQDGLNGATTVTSNSSSRSILGFVFNNTGTTALHSVSGTTRSFIIGSGGVTVNSGAGAVTLGDPAGAGALDSYFKLDADQTWANDSSSLLTVAYTAGSTAAIMNNSSTTPRTLTLAGSGSGGITVAGRITDNGVGTTAVTINMSGSGEVTFTTASSSSSHSYTGATTVQAGTLKLALASSTNNIANSSSILVGDTAAHSGAVLDVTGLSNGTIVLGDGQTIGGHGTITGGVDVANGTLAPGASVGTLTVGGDLTFQSGSQATVEVNGWSAGQYDLTQGTAAAGEDVAFAGTLVINFASDFATVGSAKIFDFDSYSGAFDVKTFNNLATGYTASFDDTTGVLTVIPEPASMTLIALGGAWVMARRRRR